MTRKSVQCLIYFFEQSAPTLAIFPEKFISRIGRIKCHLSTGVSSKRQKTKEILLLFLIKSIFYLNRTPICSSRKLPAFKLYIQVDRPVDLNGCNGRGCCPEIQNIKIKKFQVLHRKETCPPCQSLLTCLPG